MQAFPVTRVTQSRTRPADDALRFGKVFTDHMFMMEYDEGRGWHDARIVPYAPLSMDPACCVLHYAQAVFDGLKAFRGVDGEVRIFRGDKHAARLNRLCDLLCIPQLDPALVQDSFRALVDLDRDWVPSKRGTALYIRPTVIATETFLGVHPSHSYLYYVILSPVGAYYKEGLNPVKILATDQHVRAVPGGLGAAIYSPQALWTAVHECLPVTFMVMNNREYNVLRKFMKAQAHYLGARVGRFNAMGLVDPQIEFLVLAAPTGVPAQRISQAAKVAGAVEAGIASGMANLIKIPITASQ